MFSRIPLRAAVALAALALTAPALAQQAAKQGPRTLFVRFYLL